VKKLSTMVVLGVSLLSLAASAAVTVRYHNGDSKKHTFEATCSGSHTSVSFDGSTTSSVTIQGSGPCAVKHAGGTTELKGDEHVEIKDGKITVTH
jgi:hypothetical protein